MPRKHEPIDMDTIRLAKRGDQNAVAAVIKSVDPFIKMKATVMLPRSRHVELDDLVSECRIAVIHAIKKFDPDRGLRFLTYASWWIRSALETTRSRNFSLMNDGSMIQHNGMRKLVQALDTNDSSKLVGKKAAGALDAVRLAVSQPLDIDETTDTGQPKRQIGGFVDPIESMAAARVSEGLRRLMVGLDHRERLVIERRYLSRQEHTLADVGRELNVSRERIRQIEGIALRKMRRRAALIPELREAANV